MLNKTLKANAKKIKSARSFTILGIVAVLVAGVFSYKIHYSACRGLAIDNKCIALERVDTDVARAHGLSDRNSLAKDSGMLFVYQSPAEQCFWMKDMHFNLDMIWIDSNKRIVQIKKDIAPSTYPNSFCANNAQYVLEFTSGDATRLGLEVGQQLHF